MDTQRLEHKAVMSTGMLIRRPVADVFEAFVDPARTTQFWFTHGSGRLAPGQPVEWRWAMYDFSITVTARVIEPPRRMVLEWPGRAGAGNTLEWRFAEQGDGSTFVAIVETGFDGSAEEVLHQVSDSSGGFALVLAGAKAWLEHGIRLNLVADRFPKGLDSH